jgi:hypothetical protein
MKTYHTPSLEEELDKISQGGYMMPPSVQRQVANLFRSKINQIGEEIKEALQDDFDYEGSWGVGENGLEWKASEPMKKIDKVISKYGGGE